MLFREVLRSLSLVCLLVALLVGLAACQREVPPPLVEVTEIAPREIEVGDRLEIHGAGFPQGRTARVKLEGAVQKPGDDPRRGLTIEASGVVTAPDRVEILVRDPFVEAFCGRGDHASHASFHGVVEVAFFANDPSAPPIAGVLRDVSLDVRPASARASVLDARNKEGERLLAFLGVTTSKGLARGLPIEKVDPGSLAERAGIQVGDVLVGADGVHVLDLGDVAPISARSIDLVVRRGDSGLEETKTLPIVEYAASRIPREYAPALLIVGLAIAVLVLLVLPGPASLSLVELRVAAKLRRERLRRLASLLFGSGGAAAVSIVTSLVVAFLALARHLVAPDLDSVALVAIAIASLVVSRLPAARGFGAKLRLSVSVGLAAILLVLALGVAVIQAGTLTLGELVRTQGALPWEFAAARSPASALLAMAYVATLVAILRIETPARTSARLFERAAVLVAAALGVCVFFGGDLVPGIGEPRTNTHAVLAAAVLLAKSWTLAAVVWGASSALGAVRPSDLRRTILVKISPVLVVATALVFAARQIVPSAAVETACGVTVVALLVLFLARSAHRVRAALLQPEPHASPFL